MKNIDIRVKGLKCKGFISAVASLSLVLGICSGNVVYAQEKSVVEEPKEVTPVVSTDENNDDFTFSGANENVTASHDIATSDTATHDIATGDTATHDIATGDTATHDIATGDTATHDIVTGDTATHDIATGDMATSDVPVNAEVNKENKNLVANAKESTKVAISKDSLTNEEAKGLEVNLKDNSTVKYDEKALGAIKGTLNNSAENSVVLVNLEKVEKASLENAAVKNAVEKNNALGLFSIDLFVKDGKAVTSIHSFDGGTATISVNFANPNNEKLQVYRVNKDGSLIAMQTSYANGVLTWVTDGHSYYMVTVVSDKQEPVKPEVSENETKPSKKDEVKKEETTKDKTSKEDKVNTAYDTNAYLWMTLLGAAIVIMVSGSAFKKLTNKK